MANFDFIETATLVACINKFLHTRSLAVFNSQFSTFNSQFSIKNGDSRENAYSERRVNLAFFTVVASCSNLSTSFSGTKLVQGERKSKFQRVNVEKCLNFLRLGSA